MNRRKNTYIMRDQVNDRVIAFMNTNPRKLSERTARFSPRLIASTLLLAYVAVAALG